MADASDIQRQINMLKFQLAVGAEKGPDADNIKQQINELQRQLMYAKFMQGSSD